MKAIFTIIFLAIAVLAANSGLILDAMGPPADALKVEFSSPDTSPTERLKAGHPLNVGVVVTRSTGALEITPTAKPNWMTYDAASHQFSGIPVAGEHELSVSVTDTGTGQMATGVLSFNIEAMQSKF